MADAEKAVVGVFDVKISLQRDIQNLLEKCSCRDDQAMTHKVFKSLPLETGETCKNNSVSLC